MSRVYRLERVQLIRRPLDEVFAFFADARNLEQITPDFLRFEVLTPGPIEVAPGTLIDYRLRLYGLPLRWQSRIEVFEPMRRFVDLQVRGPYRRWEHLHEFFEVPEGTLCTDRVEYEIPCGPLGRLAKTLFVQRSLDQIFDYRRERLAAIFAEPSPQPVEPSINGR